MSKRILLAISLVLICLSMVLVVSYNLYYTGVAKNSESQPQENPSDLPEGPEFVIPEGPIGTLGLVSALAAAFGIFVVANKRK